MSDYKQKIVAYKECRHAIHIPKSPEFPRDLVYVKERIYYKDGTNEPNTKILLDYKRPVWITKQYFRDHNDKKTFEKLSRLEEIRVTQSDMVNTVANRLGKRGYNRNNIRDISYSPYVYGADKDIETILKSEYKQKWGTHASEPLTVCFSDIEAHPDTDEIYMQGSLFEDDIYVSVSKKFLGNETNVIERLHHLWDKYVPDSIYKKNLKPKWNIVEDEVEVIKDNFEWINRSNADLVAYWNITYDISTILKMCRRNKVAPSSILCDPDLPQRHRVANFNINTELVNITANGKKKTKKFTDLWHKYGLTSRFMFIDQQNTFAFLRTHEAQRPSFKLEEIAKEVSKGVFKKLKLFDGVPDGLTDKEWHIWMAKNKPLEYIIYNAVDLILQKVIEDKTRDLSVKVLNMTEFSSINKLTSGPNKIIDDIYHYALTNKVNDEFHVLAVKQPNLKAEELLGRDDWIVTLDGFRMKENGLRIIKGIPEIATRLMGHVYDSDAVSSYPSNTMALGLSGLTTLREIINMKGFSKSVIKRNFINLIMGPVNTIDVSNNLLNAPKLIDITKKVRELGLDNKNDIHAN